MKGRGDYFVLLFFYFGTGLCTCLWSLSVIGIDTVIKFTSFHFFKLNNVLHVWFSQVAALIPKCEIGVPINGMYSDAQSRIMTQALRKIHYSLCQSHTLIIFLNQVKVLLLKHFWIFLNTHYDRICGITVPIMFNI